jgi:hypothetical protein
MHNHNITLCIITRYPNIMHREGIEVDSEVEDEAKEYLDEEEY